jgi:predicted RNA-binding Zn-ribbon protein involved in translation (DUF1610 family)
MTLHEAQKGKLKRIRGCPYKCSTCTTEINRGYDEILDERVWDEDRWEWTNTKWVDNWVKEKDSYGYEMDLGDKVQYICTKCGEAIIVKK